MALCHADESEFVAEMDMGIHGVLENHSPHEIHSTNEDGIEVKSFSTSIGSDLDYTLSQVVEFGASIIVVEDVPFYYGSDNFSEFDEVFSWANPPAVFAPRLVLILTIDVLNAVLRSSS